MIDQKNRNCVQCGDPIVVPEREEKRGRPRTTCLKCVQMRGRTTVMIGDPTCINCGANVRTPGSGRFKKRCDECQEIFVRRYNRIAQRKHREKLANQETNMP